MEPRLELGMMEKFKNGQHQHKDHALHVRQVRDLVWDHIGVLLLCDPGLVEGVLNAVAGRWRLCRILDWGGWRFRNWRATRLWSIFSRVGDNV